MEGVQALDAWCNAPGNCRLGGEGAQGEGAQGEGAQAAGAQGRLFARRSGAQKDNVPAWYAPHVIVLWESACVLHQV
eukprot:1211803-Rhodomonas_salina.2